jgi:hypothetical protein
VPAPFNLLFYPSRLGADDDGSGSMTILEAYRALIASDFRPIQDVEFHWYSAEVCFNLDRFQGTITDDFGGIYRKAVFSVLRPLRGTTNRATCQSLP